ncbi:hypothetical protein RIEGSTA812A_PEG_1153 [invertebrate metagenome]|uniref:Uncharacterized protein n=1 Tax=invertebrate metagenome TaxID=1711999 RepID=A0A484H7S5_9ZZZZ
MATIGAVCPSGLLYITVCIFNSILYCMITIECMILYITELVLSGVAHFCALLEVVVLARPA